MAQSEEFWNKLYEAFDPEMTLSGQNTELLYTDRPHDPVEIVKIDFRSAFQRKRPLIAFFTGHRGSGKSSWLLRLLAHHQERCFPIYFDIEHNLDSSKANQIDLLFLLGVAIFKAADQEGLAPDETLMDALGASVYKVTLQEKEQPTTQTVNYVELAKGALVITASLLGNKIAEKLAEAALKPFSITSGVSEEIARTREIEAKVQEVIGCVNAIIADVEAKAQKPLLVVVDGLDKIQRLEQAKLLFLDSRALRGPVCRILYTVPMLVFAQKEFNESANDCKTYLLPNVKLFHRLDHAQREESGYETMREVIRKRLVLANVRESELFDDGVIDRLIGKSGGVMRQLIRLVHDACQQAEINHADRVNMNAANAAIADLSAEWESKLTIEDRDELRKVHEAKAVSSNPLCAVLVHSLYIVAYRNDRPWYDVHPLLWDTL